MLRRSCLAVASTSVQLCRLRLCPVLPSTSTFKIHQSRLHSDAEAQTNPAEKSRSSAENETALVTTAEEVENPSEMMEFFDDKNNWKLRDVINGRSWTVDELRLKSNQDLHKLWFVLLKERNMLKTMQYEYAESQRAMPGEERLDRVDESMEAVEDVVRERNRAYLELETGETGEAPKRKVTSFAGVLYEKTLQEHLVPPHMHPKPEQLELYELPYLTEDQRSFKIYWNEKEQIKRRNREDDRRRQQGLHKRIVNS